MTFEEFVIAVVRIVGSLFVLRWALAGGVIAILTDLSDLFLMDLLHLGGVRNYQVFDKYLDQVYLATFLIVSLRWHGTVRTVAVALYAYRLVGFALFELVRQRSLLLVFPNVFEFWFMFVATMKHWRPEFDVNRRTLFGVGGLLLAGKEFQEYALHEARWLDGFTAVDAVENIWHWVTAPLR